MAPTSRQRAANARAQAQAQQGAPPTGPGPGTGAAAGAAAGAAPGVAAAFALPSSVALAETSATILATYLAFLATKRGRDESFLETLLARRRVGPDDVAQVIAEEMAREKAFADGAEARLKVSMPLALAIPDPRQRESAVRGLLNQEQRFVQQRAEAMAARAIAAVDRVILRADSPTGAFWKSSPTVKEHTAGCLIMSGGGGGRGLFWPWEVLDRVHPPRHPGCPCSLHSYGEALASGWMRAGDVPNVKDAVAIARNVMMESDAAALAESIERTELRAELERRGWLDGETFDRVVREPRA